MELRRVTAHMGLIKSKAVLNDSALKHVFSVCLFCSGNS